MTATIEVGLPSGVLSVLPGTGPVACAELSAHSLVGALSLIGSKATGRAVLTAAAASNFKRVSLEMGGKSPQILFADALAYGDALYDNVFEAMFLIMGENCSAGSRILVHASIAAEVTERVVQAAQALTVGEPVDPRTQIGPLISSARRDRVHAMVRRAAKAGARILTGGAPIDQASGGCYYRQPFSQARRRIRRFNERRFSGRW